jgi:hypothetical protein
MISPEEFSNHTEHSRLAFEDSVNAARAIAVEMLPQAKSVADFMLLSNAVRYLTPESLEWAKEYSPDASPEVWLSEFNDERNKQLFAQEAQYLHQLQALLASSDSDSVQIAILRIHSDDSHLYRVFARFPGNVDSYDLDRVSDSQRDTVYMSIESACSRHEADVLLGESDQVIFETENLDRATLYRELRFGLVADNVMHVHERDLEGNITFTRDPRLYILNALQGGFNNENFRFLVSDFVPDHS